MDNNTNNEDKNAKKPKRFKKILIIFVCFIVVIFIAWTAFSMIGRINPESVIPDTAILRFSISNPMRLIDGIVEHEPLQEITGVPALAPVIPVLNTLKEGSLLKNRLVRFAARGNMEIAILPDASDSSETLLAVWDMKFFSPLLRVLPSLSVFTSVKNLYYVQAGNQSRFEYRMEDRTLFIGPYRNLLFITDSSAVYESRSVVKSENTERTFNAIKPSDYDATLLLSAEFVGSILTDQDEEIAAVIRNINFDSTVEAGLTIHQKKLEFRLVTSLSSGQTSLSRLLEQRSSAPNMAESIPASQYATILSAGTLEELYQAALVFSGPSLDDTLKRADSASHMILGLTLNDLLFSWSGKEFAAFGMEGRPHPVYMIQINDERKRQEVFDKAFKSIVLNEDVRLNLDGTRIPRIEVPEFLQSLLRRWNLFLPSPYYFVYKDNLLVSESAESLLAALRAMQRNDVLLKTDSWKTIAGGKSSASAFSLYYSLDRDLPFFLRRNTALSGFMGVYKQGLVRLSFNRGRADVSFSLVPGFGSGVIMASGYPLDISGRPSNRVYGTIKGDESRLFLSAGNKVISFNPADNSTIDFSGQGQNWIIPAEGVGGRNDINAWVVSDRGRVTLVDKELETEQGFPVLTGLRLSTLPVAYEGRLYLCDEDGRVHTVDAKGGQSVWENSFIAALRSPPSFLTLPPPSGSRNAAERNYAAVYPKSFFGELWLLDTDGKVLPNWPISVSGIGFGSPLLFAHNDSVNVAFVSQDGELSIYNEDAGLVSPFPVFLDGIFYIQPVFDGEFLWLASAEGAFFRVSLNGEVLYQQISGFSAKEEGSISIFDSDGNKVPEVYITGEGNALHAYSRNFRSLEGFPLPVWGKPLFVPAQGSKKPEIYGIGMDRRLYRWQFK